ncbi:MAG: AAA family ATPase [Candidatus Micrarchaeaceae archaeon]
MQLSDLLTESKIFANREVLSPHYIPSHLIGREREINSIEHAVAPALKGERGRNLFIYGKTGVGKTSCVKYVIDEVKNLPNTRGVISYINCRVYNSRYRVLSRIIAEHLTTYAKRGYGSADLYEKIRSWIEEDNKILVVALDEIDMVKDLDELVYTLTRINSDVKAGGVTMIGIANNVSFKESLDPRSISSLYESEIVFSAYNANEIYEILKKRAEVGFKPGVASDEVLRIIAAAATKEGGDARIALAILSKAGELTEEAELPSIPVSIVDKALKMAESEVVYDLISSLPEHQKLLLYAIAILTLSGGTYKKLTEGNEVYIFSGEVYNRYKSLSDSMHKDTKYERWYRKTLAELEMQGLILSFESGKGIKGHTKLIKLMYPAQKVKEAIEKEFSTV